jgi:lipopolysaccharide transport system permease protein
MLAKISFPRESLLLAGMYEVFYNLIIKIVLLGAIFIAFQQVPGWSTLAGLSGFLALALLGAAIGVILTPVAMLYLDVQKAIAVVLQFAIYLTPVIYPEPKGGIAEAIMKFNPVAPVLTTARQWLLDVPVGDVSSFFTIVAVAFVLLALGIFSFRLAMPIIIERIGS